MWGCRRCRAARWCGWDEPVDRGGVYNYIVAVFVASAIYVKLLWLPKRPPPRGFIPENHQQRHRVADRMLASILLPESSVSRPYAPRRE